MIVPLPPPDGELTTKSVPLGVAWFTGPASCSSFTLLDILNLLAKFLHFCFDRQTSLLDHEVRRFRKCRVGLAIKLLQEEIEHLSRLARSIECFLKLRQMAAQTYHLFTDVTAVCEISDFLGQTHRIDLDDLSTTVQQLTDPFLQSH